MTVDQQKTLREAYNKCLVLKELLRHQTIGDTLAIEAEILAYEIQRYIVPEEQTMPETKPTWVADVAKKIINLVCNQQFSFRNDVRQMLAEKAIAIIDKHRPPEEEKPSGELGYMGNKPQKDNWIRDAIIEIFEVIYPEYSVHADMLDTAEAIVLKHRLEEKYPVYVISRDKNGATQIERVESPKETAGEKLAGACNKMAGLRKPVLPLSHTRKQRRKVMNLTKKANWRIIVDVEEPILILGTDIEKATRRHCEDLIRDIIRHIDIDGGITYEYDTVCAFCDSLWETEPSHNDPVIPFGQPLCCDEARVAWEAAEKAKENK